MITVEKLLQVRKCIVHAGCADGMASAILLNAVLDNVEFKFLQYGAKEYEELEPEPGMLFADFSPYKRTHQKFVDAGTIVLDHHKTAKNVVRNFGDNAVFADEKEEPGVSGALLVYRHVVKPLIDADKVSPSVSVEILRNPDRNKLERIAVLAGILDTWQRKSPDWEEAQVQGNTLTFYPKEHFLGHPGLPLTSIWNKMLDVGRIQYERNMISTKRSIDGAHRFTTEAGTRVIVFGGKKNTSDAAELLDTTVDLVVGFSFVVENGKQRMTLSTRSHTDFECSLLAWNNGGGGHTAAAGFAQDLIPMSPNPYTLIEEIVKDHEAHIDEIRARYIEWQKAEELKRRD